MTSTSENLGREDCTWEDTGHFDRNTRLKIQSQVHHIYDDILGACVYNINPNGYGEMRPTNYIA